MDTSSISYSRTGEQFIFHNILYNNFYFKMDYNLLNHLIDNCCSVPKSCPTLCDPHGLQHARFPCPSLSSRVSSDSCPLSQWCYSTSSSSEPLGEPCKLNSAKLLQSCLTLCDPMDYSMPGSYKLMVLKYGHLASWYSTKYAMNWLMYWM